MSAGEGIDVAGIAQTIMIGVTAHFAASEVELPDRQVIAPGASRVPAWDCEQVTVTCDGIGVGQAPSHGGIARQTGNPVSAGARYAVLVVQIVRCSPISINGEPPDADGLTEVGLAMMRDAGLLSQALTELCGRDGALKRSGAALAGAVEFLGPEGGFSAVEGSATVTVMGLT